MVLLLFWHKAQLVRRPEHEVPDVLGPRVGHQGRLGEVLPGIQISGEECLEFRWLQNLNNSVSPCLKCMKPEKVYITVEYSVSTLCRVIGRYMLTS